MGDSKSVIGLDLATSAGVAYGLVGCMAPFAHTIDLGADKTFAERGARLMRALHPFLKENRVDLAVVEEPLALEAMKRLYTPFDTIMNQYGLAGVALTVLQMHGIKTVMATPQAVRKAFTGRATYRESVHPVTKKTIPSREMGKAATVNACRLRGWAVNNDDEADALACWSYGCGLLGAGGALFEMARR